jgi:4-hydroxy-tetrahydrodipicolinate synthase
MSRPADPELSVNLSGVTPILVTPYDEDGRIAFDDIDSQVDYLAGLDIAAIGIAFGSDILRLTERERDVLIARVAERAAGRRPVVASVGANSTSAAVERAVAAIDAGADILMVIPPGAITQAGPKDLVEYYTAVAQKTQAPIIVQDAPGLTGTTMSTDLLAQLARDVPKVVALKIEAVPSAPKIGHLAGLDHGSAVILGGAGGLDFFHELRRGADGTIPGVALTELFVDVYRRYRVDPSRARRTFDRFLPLVALTNRDGPSFYRSQLDILSRRGLVTQTHLRAPAREDPLFVAELDELLATLGMANGRWTLDGDRADAANG